MEQTYNSIDLIDSQVSEDAFEQDPVLAAFQNENEQGYWIDELESSRKEREKFVKRGVDTVKRYADDRGSGDSRFSKFNIFFANTEIKMSSLYARTPQPDIKRRFNDSNDQISRVAANILQRNIMYELECEGFDATFKQVLFDRLVPGLGILWNRLDHEEGDYEYDHMGMPIEGSQVKYQLAAIDYVAWDDFAWSPCRTWTACRWVSRRIPMSKPAVQERFKSSASPELLSQLSFGVKSEIMLSKDSMRPKHSTEPTVDVHEIWDKERGLIFWVSEGCPVPLDIQKDTNEFPGFFPTALPPLCRTTTSSTIPISDFSLVQDQYNELDDLNNRASNLVRALQVRWVYDAGNLALRDLYTTVSELEGIAIDGWDKLKAEKGGLQNSIEFAPLNEIAEAYMKLIQARDMVKSQIMEVEGISDYLRGVNQPYVTATAAQSTAQASTGRLSVEQQVIADYIQRTLRSKAHIICKFYTPQTIMSRVGSLPDADMQFVPQALQLLANEQGRHFRLEVSVDSIQQANWNQDKAERNELVHAVTALMQTILAGADQHPEMLPAGLELMKFNVTGYKGAQAFEGTLDNMMQKLLSAQAQKQQQPPKLSPDEMKANVAQAQIQATLQKSQMDNDTTRLIAQMKAQLDQQRIQIDAMKADTERRDVDRQIEADRAKVHIDVLDSAHGNALDIAGLGGK